MYFRCLLPVAVEMLFMSTASGSRVGFHIYCHFLVAVEVAVAVAVEMAVEFRTKMTNIFDQNDRYQNENTTKLTVINQIQKNNGHFSFKLPK